jgi:glycosyltransferase involved in cell wall biosynthesis
LTLVADSSLAPSDAPAGVDVVRVALRVAAGVAASADGHRSLPDMWAMSRALARVPADAIFFPTVYSFVPVWTRLPIVVGIHDVIAERLPGHVFHGARSRRFWNAKVWMAVRQATRVMTVSEHAAGGIERQLRVPRSRMRIVGEAAAAAFASGAALQPGYDALRTAGMPPDARFFLYVGGIAPHKNLDALLAALDRLPGDVRLAIVGDFEHDAFLSAYSSLKARAQEALPGRVAFTGRLEDAAVAALMRLAQALVLPSFDEGFGLPAVEAAACGGAVIATRHSAIPEVLGDAALYIDPDDRASLEQAMATVLADPQRRAALGRRAAARAADWTWESAARRMLAIFEELSP